MRRPLYKGRSLQALTQIGCFPAEPWFQSGLEAVGLADVLDAKTLALSVSRYLAAAQTVEDVSPILDALLSDIEIAPGGPLEDIARESLRDLSLQDLAVSALIDSHPQPPRFLQALPRLEQSNATLSIKASVDLVECAAECHDDRLSIDMMLSAVATPDAYLDALDPTSVWEFAESSLELEVAVALEAKQLGALSSIRDVPPFRIGTAFAQSLVEIRAAGAGPLSSVVRQKCALSVLGQRYSGARVFRTDKSASSPSRKRTRDNAEAMRVHVTGGHEALRLMYWNLPIGGTELACVRVKSDIYIDSGVGLGTRGW